MHDFSYDINLLLGGQNTKSYCTSAHVFMTDKRHNRMTVSCLNTVKEVLQSL